MNKIDELLTQAKRERDLAKQAVLYNQALAEEPYETLASLFCMQSYVSPSWFHTFKGVNLSDLSVGSIPADEWLNGQIEAGETRAFYIRYLWALRDIKLIRVLTPFPEQKALYESRIPDNEAVIRDMLPKAAKAGHYEARLELARQYRSGDIFQEDYAKALALLQSLYEEKKDPELLYQIGIIYFGGNGVSQDLKVAADYLTRSGTDKGCLKIANGPSCEEICRTYELRCEIKKVIGTKSIGGGVIDSLIAESDVSSLSFHEYSKTPEIVVVPLTGELLSVKPYGYDISEELLVKGEKILKHTMTLERLDSVVNVVQDNFDKICLHMVKKEKN